MSETIRLNKLESGLVKAGLFTEQKIIEISKEAKANKKELIFYIQDNELAPDKEICNFLTDTFGFQTFDLDIDFDPHEMPRNLIDEQIVEKGRVLPLQSLDGTIVIAVSNPSGMQKVDAIRSSSNFKTEIVVVEHHKLNEIIDRFYGKNKNAKSDDELYAQLLNGADDFPMAQNGKIIDVTEADENSPMVLLVNRILLNAIRLKASDLHFEPFEKEYRIRFRVDGVLRTIKTVPVAISARMTSRLKLISNMDIAEKRKPQDGRIRLQVSKTKAIDFRVSSLPTMYGEKLVLRILDSTSATLGIDSLGFEPKQKEMYLNALSKPQGLILITGQTGSGKTVSLYTGLNILNTEDRNISTAEEPVEIDLVGVNQVNVQPKLGMDFATALRAFLRQDPDVIMVGEIRDLETAEISIKASQTGHLVLSTLHTNSASETLTRLRNMGVPSYNVATSVNLVIAQRLARRLCTRCKVVDDTYTEKALLDFGFTPEQIADPEFKIYKAVGCKACNDGYKGRVGVYEVLEISPELSKIIMDDGNSIEIEEQALKDGFQKLRVSGRNKILDGLTTLQEIDRVTKD